MKDSFALNLFSIISILLIGIGNIGIIAGSSTLPILSNIGMLALLISLFPERKFIIGIAASMGGFWLIATGEAFGWILAIGGLISFFVMVLLSIRLTTNKINNYILTSLLLLLLAHHFVHIKLDFLPVTYLLTTLLIVFTYTYRYAKKRPRILLDFLKLSFATILLIKNLIVMNHAPFYGVIVYLTIITSLSLGAYSLFYKKHETIS